MGVIFLIFVLAGIGMLSIFVNDIFIYYDVLGMLICSVKDIVIHLICQNELFIYIITDSY